MTCGALIPWSARVLVAGGSQLVGIDPVTDVPDEAIDLGLIGYDVAVGTNAVWVISNKDDAVVRIDPTSRKVTDRIDGVNEPVGIDADGDVWIATVESTDRIDPTSLAMTVLPIPVGYGGMVDAAGADLWVRSAERFLLRVDVVTGEIRGEFDAGVDSGGEVIVAFDAVWATAFDDALLVRLPL